jgi:hypothetical protein
VYGEMLGAAQRLVQQLSDLDVITQRFLGAAADTAASRRQEKDQGICEIRGERRDFLCSKLQCWAARSRSPTSSAPSITTVQNGVSASAARGSSLLCPCQL